MVEVASIAGLKRSPGPDLALSVNGSTSQHLRILAPASPLMAHRPNPSTAFGSMAVFSVPTISVRYTSTLMAASIRLSGRLQSSLEQPPPGLDSLRPPMELAAEVASAYQLARTTSMCY